MLKSFSILISSGLMLASCNNSTDSTTTVATETPDSATATTVIAVEEVYTLPPIEEKKVANVHMNKKHHAAKKEGKPTETVDAEPTFETVNVDVLIAALQESDTLLVVLPPPPPVVVVVDTVTVTKSAKVLNQDQTVVAIGKKNSKNSSMEVISDPNNPNVVSQIRYTAKGHTDVYNVEAGMSNKDVRRLRRDMRYMKRNGKTYMYSDDSNVMYEMRQLIP